MALFCDFYNYALAIAYYTFAIEYLCKTTMNKYSKSTCIIIICSV